MRNTSCMQITIAGMVMTGTWLPKCLENSKWKPFYYVYSVIFQTTFFLSMICIQTVHLFLVLGDIAKTVEVSVLLLTHFAQVAKVVIIWLRQARIKALFDLLESPVFNREEPEKRAILDNILRIAFMVSKTLALASGVTGALWGVFPLLQPELTLPLGYPYMETGTVIFMILYAHQAAGIFLCAIGDTAEDFLAGGLVAIAAAQLDLLYYELLNIRNNEVPKIESEPEKQNMGSPKEDNSGDDYEKVVACVKFHQEIVKYVKELDAIFGAPVFCQFTMSCLIICMTALKITISTEPTEIITMIFYLLCILAELMVYCYSGDIIMHKSQLIAEAAYCCSWVGTSLRTHRTLLLLALRAQRPLTVTAGNMFDLSLKTFTTILRSSYSYFAVLNQKNNK